MKRISVILAFVTCFFGFSLSTQAAVSVYKQGPKGGMHSGSAYKSDGQLNIQKGTTIYTKSGKTITLTTDTEVTVCKENCETVPTN